MKRKRKGLDAFLACMTGDYDRIADWSDVVMFANTHLIGPELHRRLRDFSSSDIDPDALAYFESQDFANQERNRRIVEQLKELTTALTNKGVTSVLIKGASVLAQAPKTNAVARITSDIDIVVERKNRDEAEAVLSNLGYEQIDGTAWGHSSGSYARHDVVAAVDLHFQLPTAIEKIVPLNSIFERGRVLELGQGSAVVPDNNQQLLLNIAHEMLHDRHLSKGFTNLRYLIELEHLQANAPPDASIISERLKEFPKLKAAFEAQDRMAQGVLNKRLFPFVAHTMRGQLLHARRMIKLRFERLGHWEWAAILYLRRSKQD